LRILKAWRIVILIKLNDKPMSDNTPENRFSFLKKDFSIGNLLIQIISVVLAVVLGFIVNQWRENQATEKKVKLAMKRISTEMMLNADQVNLRLPYYTKMYSTLDSLIIRNGDKELNNSDIKGWLGLNPPILASSAYDVASTTGLFANMKFEQAENFERIYHIQKVFEQSVNYAIESYIDGKLDKSSTWSKIFHTQYEIGNDLVKQYDTVFTTTLKPFVNNTDHP